MKRRSGASSTPPEPVFFIDRSLGKHKVPDALRAVGARVEIHDAHFPPNAKDTDWLPVVGKRGWVVLTKDDRIRYRQHERAALLGARVRAFVLTNRNLSGDEMAAIFVGMLEKMKKVIRREPSGFVATVTRTRIRLVATPERSSTRRRKP